MAKQNSPKLEYPLNVFCPAIELHGKAKLNKTVIDENREALSDCFNHAINSSLFTIDELLVLEELYKNNTTFTDLYNKLSISRKELLNLKSSALFKVFCIFYIVFKIPNIEMGPSVIKTLCSFIDEPSCKLDDSVIPSILMCNIKYFRPFLNDEIVDELEKHITFVYQLADFSILDIIEWEHFYGRYYFNSYIALGFIKLCHIKLK